MDYAVTGWLEYFLGGAFFGALAFAGAGFAAAFLAGFVALAAAAFAGFFAGLAALGLGAEGSGSIAIGGSVSADAASRLRAFSGRGSDSTPGKVPGSAQLVAGNRRVGRGARPPRRVVGGGGGGSAGVGGV